MKKFNKISFPYILLLLISVIILSATRIREFTARRENGAVVLKWITEDESNVQQFNIERKTNTTDWLKIGTKHAYGNSSSMQEYIFIDNNIFKTNQSNFYYRLIIVTKDGQSIPYETIETISGSSGIKHTWGSIKAMFR
jgi:hypothetical protein